MFVKLSSILSCAIFSNTGKKARKKEGEREREEEREGKEGKMKEGHYLIFLKIVTHTHYEGGLLSFQYPSVFS